MTSFTIAKFAFAVGHTQLRHAKSGKATSNRDLEKKFSGQKGAVTKVLEKAFKLWLKSQTN